MTKSALILHAWLNTQDKHWYPWLKKELEDKGYTVYLPEIPTMNSPSPDMETQIKFIEDSIPLADDFIVIGHSLGCLLAMRLAEKHAFQKMILVAGWDFDDLTPEHQSFWETKIDHAAIRQHVQSTYVVTSDNDPYITAITAEDMCKRLNGIFILVKGAGHFTETFGITEIPEVLQYV